MPLVKYTIIHTIHQRFTRYYRQCVLVFSLNVRTRICMYTVRTRTHARTDLFIPNKTQLTRCLVCPVLGSTSTTCLVHDPE